MTVYVMGCKGSQLVKIGHAGDPEKRLRDLRWLAPQGLSLLWQSGPEHGFATEQQLHQIFQGWRQHGEWFDFGDADPVALVSAAIDLPLPALEQRATPSREPRVTSRREPRVKRLMSKRIAPDSSLLTADPMTPAAQAALPHGYAVGEEVGPPYIGAWD